jgi:serine/threonine protein phosphatase 1
MALIAIGDIHGCAGSLEDLLRVLDPGADDHLVYVGDYVDRGPDSRGVIDIVLDLSQSVECTFLRGNHEAFFLEYLQDGFSPNWSVNGGDDTLESYRRDGHIDVPDAHIDFLNRTKLFHETDEFVFVHAGLRPELTVQKNLQLADEHVFLWERAHMATTRRNWEKTVVCGHTPVTEPLNERQLINIDTGCVYYNRPGLGKLTAVRLPEREFVQVPFSG